MMMLREQLLLVALQVIVFTSILTLDSAQAMSYEEPLPIRYLATPFGGLILVEGVQMTSDNVTMTFQNSSKCHCRSACSVYPAFNAFSLVPQDDGTLECQLTTRDLMSLFYLDNATNAALFGYKEAALQCRVKGKMADGFLYCVSASMGVIKDSDEWCRQIPGFRQSISKTTKELEVLVDVSNKASGPLSVILRNETGSLLWSNAAEMGFGGLIYDETTLSSSQYFMLNNADKRFRGEGPTRNTYYLCQASNFIH